MESISFTGRCQLISQLFVSASRDQQPDNYRTDVAVVLLGRKQVLGPGTRSRHVSAAGKCVPMSVCGSVNKNT